MPLAQLHLFQFTAVVLLCGLSDRLIGWGGLGRTKPLVLAAVGLAAWSWWVGLPPAAVAAMPLAFLAWRTPAWDLAHTGGTINPTTPAQDAGTALRHALALGFVIPAALAHLPLAPVVAALCGFVAAATALAVINGATQAKGNGLVETVRGLCLGAALGAAYVALR